MMQTSLQLYHYHCSVANLCPTLCDTVDFRLLCPSLFSGVCSSSCPLNWWCHPTILSSVALFHLQCFPASRSSPMSQLFASGGQSIGVSTSTSVLPMNIQGWFPLGLSSLISLQSKGFSIVFSSTTAQKHQFFDTVKSVKLTKMTHALLFPVFMKTEYILNSVTRWVLLV